MHPLCDTVPTQGSIDATYNFDDTPVIIDGDCSHDMANDNPAITGLVDIMLRLQLVENSVFELEFEVATLKAQIHCVPTGSQQCDGILPVSELERMLPPSPGEARPTINEPLEHDLEKQLDPLLSIPLQTLLISCCGTGECGELGLGPSLRCKEIKRPRENEFFTDKRIVDIKAGGMHTLYLASDGAVFSHGVGDDGALGRPTEIVHDDNGLQGLVDWDEVSSIEAEMNPNESTPGIVNFPDGTVITRIAAGDSISVAIDMYGRVWAWGTFKRNGVNGFSATTAVQWTPCLIPTISQVVDVAAGGNYVIFMTEDALVFIVGTVLDNNDRLNSIDYFDSPTRFENLKPRAVFAGQNHGFILSGGGAKGYVMAFGANGSGQCGIHPRKGASAYIDTPTRVPYVSGTKMPNIIGIAAGSYHTLMLVETGEVLACGDNRDDQLALGKRYFDSIDDKYKIFDESCGKENRRAFALVKPHPIVCLTGHIRSIACGTHHNIFLTHKGNLYTSGPGTEYQTGHGTCEPQPVPTLVKNKVSTETFTLIASAGATFSILGGRTLSEEELVLAEEEASGISSAIVALVS